MCWEDFPHLDLSDQVQNQSSLAHYPQDSGY